MDETKHMRGMILHTSKVQLEPPHTQKYNLLYKSHKEGLHSPWLSSEMDWI